MSQINITVDNGKVRITTPQGDKERTARETARQVLTGKAVSQMSQVEMLAALTVLLVEKGYVDDSGKIDIPAVKSVAIPADAVNESVEKG